MTSTSGLNTRTPVSLRNPDMLYIDGRWSTPSTDETVEVLDSTTEQPFLRVAMAAEADISDAVAAARRAFDDGPWPRMTPTELAHYLHAIAGALRERTDVMSRIWTRESGVVHTTAREGIEDLPRFYERYAAMAESFPFEEQAELTAGKGEFGMIIREPVGTVAAILPWNSPALLATIR